MDHNIEKEHLYIYLERAHKVYMQYFLKTESLIFLEVKLGFI